MFVCMCVFVCAHDTETVQLYMDDGMIDREGGQANCDASVILPIKSWNSAAMYKQAQQHAREIKALTI